VLRLEADPGGQWWGGWVGNLRTGSEHHLGDIRVPSSHTLMGSPSNFSEYFGDAVACTRVPVSRVTWSQPTASVTEDGSVADSSYTGFSSGRCTGGSVTPRPSMVTVRLGGSRS
jgi:hypothetical protein